MAPHFYGLHAAQHRTEWGPWSFSIDFCLVNKYTKYEIDLEAVNSTADILNWLMHMSTKDEAEYGEGYMYYLSVAFADILKFCGFDNTKNLEFDGRKLCKKYAKGVRTRRPVPLRVRHQVLERDKFRCQDCGASPATGAVLEVDHTIPVSKGGTNELSNLRVLCADCNRGKSDRIVNYD